MMNLFFHPSNPLNNLLDNLSGNASHHSVLPHSRHDHSAEPDDYHPIYMTLDLIKRECKHVPLPQIISLSFSHLASDPLHIPSVANSSDASNIKPNKFVLIENLEHCVKLQELCISGHALTSLNNLFACRLSNLTSLDLSSNRIESLDDLNAVKCFQSLPALEKLDLSGNQLSKLPSQTLVTNCSNLRVLRLSNNRLCNLRDVVPLRSLVNLTSLDILDGNHSLKALPHARSFVVFCVPSLDIIDSESVSLSDRKIAEDRFARDELDVLETEVSVARGRAAESDQLCDQLKSQLQQADVKIRSLTDQNSRLVKTMSQLTMQADEQQQQIQHYASALAQARAALAQSESELRLLRIDQQLGDQSQTTASSTAENTAHTAVEMSSFESPLPPIQVLTLTPAPAASVVKKSDKTSSPFKPLGTQGKASATPVKRRLLELSNTLQSTEQQILLNSARRSRAISSEHVATNQSGLLSPGNDRNELQMQISETSKQLQQCLQEYAALSEKCLPNKMRRNFDDHDVRAATDSLKGAIEETESLKSALEDIDEEQQNLESALPPKLRRLYRQQYKVFEQSTSLISDSDRDSVFDAELKHLTDLDYLLSLAHAELSSSQPVSSPSKLTTSQLSSTSQITSVVLSDTEQQMGRTILKQLAHILRRRNTLSTDLEQSRNRVETLQTQLQDSLDLNAPFNSLSKVHQEEMLKLSQNRDSNFAALLNAFAHSNLHNDLSVLLLKEYQSALVGSESFTRVLQNDIDHCRRSIEFLTNQNAAQLNDMNLQYQARIEELSHELQLLQRTIAQQSDSFEKFAADKVDESQQLQSKFESIEAELQHQIEQLQQELSTCRQQCDELNQVNSACQLQILQLSQQNFADVQSKESELLHQQHEFDRVYQEFCAEMRQKQFAFDEQQHNFDSEAARQQAEWAQRSVQLSKREDELEHQSKQQQAYVAEQRALLQQSQIALQTQIEQFAEQKLKLQNDLQKLAFDQSQFTNDKASLAADRATFSAEKTSMDQWRVRLADEQQNVAALLSGLEQQQQRLNEQRTQQAQLQSQMEEEQRVRFEQLEKQLFQLQIQSQSAVPIVSNSVESLSAEQMSVEIEKELSKQAKKHFDVIEQMQKQQQTIESNLTSQLKTLESRCQQERLNFEQSNVQLAEMKSRFEAMKLQYDEYEQMIGRQELEIIALTDKLAAHSSQSEHTNQSHEISKWKSQFELASEQLNSMHVQHAQEIETYREQLKLAEEMLLAQESRAKLAQYTIEMPSETPGFLLRSPQSISQPVSQSISQDNLVSSPLKSIQSTSVQLRSSVQQSESSDRLQTQYEEQRQLFTELQLTNQKLSMEIQQSNECLTINSARLEQLELEYTQQSAELAQRKETLNSLRAQIQMAERDLVSQSNLLSQYVADSAAARAEYEVFALQSNSKRAELESLQTQTVKCQNELDGLQTDRVQVQASLDQLAHETQQLTSMHAELLADIDLSKVELTNSSEQWNTVRDDLHVLETQKAELQSECLSIEQNMQVQRLEFSELSRTVLLKSSELQELTEQLTETQSNLHVSQSQLTLSVAEFAKLQSEIAIHLTRQETLQTELHSLQQQFELNTEQLQLYLNEKAAQQQETLQKLQQDSFKEQERLNIEHQLWQSEFERQRTEQSTKLSELQSKCKQQTQQIDQNEAILTSLQSQCAEFESRKQTAKVEQTKATLESAEAMTKLSDLLSKCTEAATQLSDAKQSLSTLQPALDLRQSLESALQVSRRELEACEQSVQVLRDEAKQLRTQAEQSRNELHKTQFELTTLVPLVEQFQQSHSSYTKQTQVHEQNYQQLSRMKTQLETEIQLLTSQKQEQSDLLHKCSDEVQTIQTTLQQHRELLHSSQAEVQISQNAFFAAQKQLNDLHAQLNSLQQQINTSATSKSQLESDTQTLLQKSIEVQSAYNEAVELTQELHKELSSLREQHLDAQQQYHVSQQALADSQQQYQQQQQLLHSVEQQRTQADLRIVEADQYVQHVESVCRELKTQTEAQIDALNAEQVKLQRRNDEICRDVQKSETELAKLQGSIIAANSALEQHYQHAQNLQQTIVELQFKLQACERDKLKTDRELELVRGEVTRASAEAESIRSLNTNLTSTLFQANSKYQQQQHAEHQQHLSHKLQQIVEEIQRVFAKKEQGWQQRLDALQAEMSTRQREYLQAHELELSALPFIVGFGEDLNSRASAKQREELRAAVKDLKHQISVLHAERASLLDVQRLRDAIAERDEQILFLLQRLRQRPVEFSVSADDQRDQSVLLQSSRAFGLFQSGSETHLPKVSSMPSSGTTTPMIKTALVSSSIPELNVDELALSSLNESQTKAAETESLQELLTSALGSSQHDQTSLFGPSARLVSSSIKPNSTSDPVVTPSVLDKYHRQTDASAIPTVNRESPARPSTGAARSLSFPTESTPLKSILKSGVPSSQPSPFHEEVNLRVRRDLPPAPTSNSIHSRLDQALARFNLHKFAVLSHK